MKTLPFKLPFDKRELKITGSDKDTGIMQMIESGGGYYEPQVMGVLASLVEPKHVCIDIGANIGMISIALAALAGKGKVYAFEAAKPNFEFLEKNIEQNGFKNIIPIDKALYDENTTLEFNYNVTEAGGSFISGTGRKDGKIVEVHEVEAVRLDDWVRETGIKRIDLVKLDVEGAEKRVINGALETLRNLKPDLVMEFFPATLEVFHGDDAKDFYELLRSIYPYIYLIPDYDPGGSLARIDRYVDLYSAIRRGKGLADILCTHKSAPEVAERAVTRIFSDQRTCLYVNRYHDRWSRAKYGEIIFISEGGETIELLFHTNLPANLLPATVRIYYGDDVQTFKVKSHRRQKAKIPVKKGINLIAIEIDKSFNPAAFGMSSDGRELGVNFSVVGYENVESSVWF